MNDLIKYCGEAEQDKFVLNILNFKRNGYFIEIGSNDPVTINNSYILEKLFGWKGIMIEMDKSFLELYKITRQNSIHVINDATKIDYISLFQKNNVPTNIDYLQIDLEVTNNSTLKTLQKLDNEIFDNYRFATITFEHDIYIGDYFNTRLESRQIFKKRGYILVFSDVKNCNCRYEDWYIHPELVNEDYINKIKKEGPINWSDIKYYN